MQSAHDPTGDLHRSRELGLRCWATGAASRRLINSLLSQPIGGR